MTWRVEPYNRDAMFAWRNGLWETRPGWSVQWSNPYLPEFQWPNPYLPEIVSAKQPPDDEPELPAGRFQNLLWEEAS